MNKCIKCGNQVNTVITENYFGHGDVTQTSWVVCKTIGCDNKGTSVSDWGCCEMKVIHNAIDNWDKENPKK